MFPSPHAGSGPIVVLLSSDVELLVSSVVVAVVLAVVLVGMPDVLADVLGPDVSEVVPSVSSLVSLGVASSPHARRRMARVRLGLRKVGLRSADLSGGTRAGSTDCARRTYTAGEGDHAPNSSRAITSFWISLVPS